MQFVYAFLLWAAMVMVAIINGLFADRFIEKITGGYISHLYKTALIITVIFVVSHWYLEHLNASTEEGRLYGVALATGVQWLASSIIFEFIIGHYVFGFSWERLFADYKVWEGRLWSLVLASEVAAPLINTYLITRH